MFSGLTRSPLFFAIFVLCAIFQYTAVQHLGEFMHTTPLNAEQWKYCVLLALLEVPLGLFVNLLPIKQWSPGPNTDNSQGLDGNKRAAIRNAKMAAGMIAPTPTSASSGMGKLFGSAKGRWKTAITTTRMQTKVVRMIEKSALKKRDTAHNIWGRHATETLAFGPPGGTFFK
eukprot:NODE_2193_length_969_cov_116.894565_g130_i1.p2 GENE.NODE_2193_length_969_cov_116.894565_g130_i1~~NODE_2193_length_969_cov_116.894565_g130_i1.p2  ORF type:complete len:172 (+),score=59.03 NODE_2193_length_969_cov_116.894565_g130_i1:250-765(+)